MHQEFLSALANTKPGDFDITVFEKLIDFLAAVTDSLKSEQEKQAEQEAEKKARQAVDEDGIKRFGQQIGEFINREAPEGLTGTIVVHLVRE